MGRTPQTRPLPDRWDVEVSQHDDELRVAVTNTRRPAVRHVQTIIALDDYSVLHTYTPRLPGRKALSLCIESPGAAKVPKTLTVRWKTRLGRQREWATDL
jgi:hypothetical protein